MLSRLAYGLGLSKLLYFHYKAGEGGKIPVNGLCRDGRGICDDTGVCIFLDGTFAKADLSRLVKESAGEAFQLLSNYW